MLRSAVRLAERRRPAALSTAYNGASVGGTLFTPIWVAAIAAFGFAAASIGRPGASIRGVGCGLHCASRA